MFCDLELRDVGNVATTAAETVYEMHVGMDILYLNKCLSS